MQKTFNVSLLSKHIHNWVVIKKKLPFIKLLVCHKLYIKQLHYSTVVYWNKVVLDPKSQLLESQTFCKLVYVTLTAWNQSCWVLMPWKSVTLHIRAFFLESWLLNIYQNITVYCVNVHNTHRHTDTKNIYIYMHIHVHTFNIIHLK